MLMNLNAVAYDTVIKKKTPPLLPLLWQGRGGNALVMHPLFGVPAHPYDNTWPRFTMMFVSKTTSTLFAHIDLEHMLTKPL